MRKTNQCTILIQAAVFSRRKKLTEIKLQLEWRMKYPKFDIKLNPATDLSKVPDVVRKS